MSPSREACESALKRLSDATVIAFGVLAAGYLQPKEAATYLAGVPNLTAVAVGASTPDQALDTLGIFDASWLRAASPVPTL